MLDEKTIRALAARIEQARNTHELIRPVTAQFPEATIEDAYAIQRAWVAIRLAAGYRVLGHKIGLTSKAMQSQSSVKEPDYGCLLDDTVFADGAEIPAGTFTAPRVEGRAGVHSEQAAAWAGLHDFRCAERNGFPHSVIGDPRLAAAPDRSGRPARLVRSSIASPTMPGW